MNTVSTTIPKSQFKPASLIICQDEQGDDFLDVLRDKLNDPYPNTQIICVHSSCEDKFLRQLESFKRLDPNLGTVQLQDNWDGEKLCEALRRTITGDEVFWLGGNGSVRNKIILDRHSIRTRIDGRRIMSIRADEHVGDYLDKEAVDIVPAPFPKMVGMFLNSSCNYRCFFCEDRPPVHFPIEDFYKLKPVIQNAEILNITGTGEPLFYKYIREAIQFITENNSKDCISLNTNGSLLTEELAVLLSKCLHFISISLNAATKKTYERDMKNGRWDTVMNNIRTARKYIPRDKMALVFVAHGDNIQEFPDFVRLAKELDVGQVEMKNFIVLNPDHLGKSLWFHKDKTNSMVDLARSLGRQFNIKVVARNFNDDCESTVCRSDCTAPFDQAYIAANGNVAACCFAKQPMGNIYTAGCFENVWNGRKYRRLRKERYFPECKTCGNANPWNKFESHLNTALYKGSSDIEDSVRNLLEILYEWRASQNVDDDTFVRVLHKLGEEAMDYTQDSDRAIKIFSEAVSIKPDSASAHNNIGFAYCRQEKPDMALQSFTRAVELEPANRLYVVNCGKLLESMDMEMQARDVYTNFLQIRPGDREIGNMLHNLNSHHVADLDFSDHKGGPASETGEDQPLDHCLEQRCRKIFVTGISTSGKTTFAKRYASNRDIDYVSFDDLHRYHYPGHPDRPIKTNQAVKILSELPCEFVIDAMPEFAYSEGSHIWSDFLEYYERHEGEIQIVCTICSSLSQWLKRIYARANKVTIDDIPRHLYRWRLFYKEHLNVLLDKNLVFFDSCTDRILTKEQGIELVSSIAHEIKIGAELFYMMDCVSPGEKERIIKDTFRLYLDTLGYDKTYQDIEMIDYKGYSNTAATWENIKDLVSWKGKKVLALGCFHGYISFKAEEAGAIVEGLDLSNEVLITSEIINDISRHNVKFAQWEGGQATPECDIILCLNVLHHFNVPELALHRMNCKQAVFEINEDAVELVQRYFAIQRTVPSHRENRVIVLADRLRSGSLNREALDLLIEGDEILSSGENPALAVEKFSQALQLRPDFAYAYNRLARGYWHLGKRDLALEQFCQAVQLEPTSRLTVLSYGEALINVGMLTEAAMVYEQYLKSKPGDRVVSEPLERLNQMMLEDPSPAAKPLGSNGLSSDERCADLAGSRQKSLATVVEQQDCCSNDGRLDARPDVLKLYVSASDGGFPILQPDDPPVVVAQKRLHHNCGGPSLLVHVSTKDYRVLSASVCKSTTSNSPNTDPNQKLIEEARTFRPDIILLMPNNATEYRPQTLKELKETCRVYLAARDGDACSYSCDRVIKSLKIAAHVDLMISVDGEFVQNANQGGLLNVEYIPSFVNEHETKVQVQRKTIDILFAGTGHPGLKMDNDEFMYEKRRDFIRRVDQAFSNRLLVIGPGWTNLNLSNVRDDFISEELVHEYAMNSKIVIAYDGPLIRNFTSVRTFRSLMSGAFVLIRYFPGIEDMFVNHKHLVWFKTHEEGLELIEYYLKHDAERAAVAKAGYEFLLSNHGWRRKTIIVDYLVRKYEGEKRNFAQLYGSYAKCAEDENANSETVSLVRDDPVATRELVNEALRQYCFQMWQRVYQNGYDSSSGDHSRNFYNKYLEEIGYYRELSKAGTVVEFAPGKGEFMANFIRAAPQKRFFFVDISEANLEFLKAKFSGHHNVFCVVNNQRNLPLSGVGSVFSFILCQCMPKSLWLEHMQQVYRVLNDGGSYVFQFAFNPELDADDSVQKALSGSHVYTAEQMDAIARSAGFQQVELTSPIDLRPMSPDTNTVWYICKALKATGSGGANAEKCCLTAQGENTK
jgi:MoaA/NifB/PqqE/SkfB family radical SAM enzyme/Tfp pilus assembly protein PilF